MLNSVTCLLVITLGLTASLCVYSIAYEYMGPPPFPDGDRFILVGVDDAETGKGRNMLAFNGYAHNFLKGSTSSFEEFGAFRTSRAILSDGDISTSFEVSLLSPSLMAMTEIQPLLGRQLTAQDTEETNTPVVLISYQLWQTYYAGTSDIVGSQTRIDGVLHDIIGVMPDGFRYPFAQDLWMPISIADSASVDDPNRYGLIGKLKTKVSRETATNEMNLALAQLRNDIPDDYRQLTTRVENFNSIKIGGGRINQLGFLYSISVIIFLLAALNLGTLLFTRANERRQELAVRNAVGANRWQLRKQIMIESAILCVAGCLLALLLSELLLRIFRYLTESAAAAINVPLSYNFGIHPPVVGYAALITFIIWILSASTAAYKVSKNDINTALKSSSGSGAVNSRALTTRLIIGIEVVFSCFLLVLCGAMVSSILRAGQIDYGANTDGIVVGDISLLSTEYQDPQDRLRYLDELGNTLESDSGLSTSAFSTALPGGWSEPRQLRYALEDRNVKVNESFPTVAVASVSTNYFSVLGVNTLTGRAFSSADNYTSLSVAIVDEILSENLWPNESAIGKRIQINPEVSGEWLTVVGTNSHIAHGQPTGGRLRQPIIYRPIHQTSPTEFHLLGRALPDSNMTTISDSIGSIASTVDRNIPVERIMSLYDFQLLGLSIINFLGQIISAFAALALLLSVLGIYGIVSRSVLLRSNEIGIRRALGSSDRKIVSIFLQQGANYLSIGAVLGGITAVLASAGLSVVFPDILTGVPVVAAVVLLTLGTLIMVASYVPAKKVVMLEPGEALHYE